jgi:hypothetical protein
MIDKMSDCGETDLPGVRHKEDMSIYNKNIDANADLLLELY